MRDFNFFEAYLKADVKKKNNSHGILIASAAIMALMLVIFTFNTIRVMGMQREIDELVHLSQSPQFIERYKSAMEKQRELEDLKTDRVFFASMEDHMKQNDYVNEAFIRFISSEVPQNVAFTTLMIENRDITLEGTSADKVGIAQLEYNLRQTGDFSHIFIPTMEMDNNLYTFSMVLQTKDVTADEDK